MECDDLVLVKQSFNKAAATYTQHSQVQTGVCDNLVDRLVHYGSKFDSMADFACGNGISTTKLLDIFMYQHCISVDIAGRLLIDAKKSLGHYANLSFIEADYNSLLFQNNSLDLAFANMGFQWSVDFVRTCEVMWQQLKSKGILAFSLPIADSFASLRAEYRHEFIEFETINNILQVVGFKVLDSTIENYTERFYTPMHAIKSIKSIGANINLKSNNSGLLTRASLERMFVSTNYDLNYRIGLFIVIKE